MYSKSDTFTIIILIQNMNTFFEEKNDTNIFFVGQKLHAYIYFKNWYKHFFVGQKIHAYILKDWYKHFLLNKNKCIHFERLVRTWC